MVFSFLNIRINKFSRGNTMMIIKYMAVARHRLSHNYISPTYTKSCCITKPIGTTMQKVKNNCFLCKIYSSANKNSMVFKIQGTKKLAIFKFETLFLILQPPILLSPLYVLLFLS